MRVSKMTILPLLRSIAVVAMSAVALAANQHAAIAGGRAQPGTIQSTDAADVATGLARALADVGAAPAVANPAVETPRSGTGEVAFAAGATAIEMGIPADGAAVSGSDGVTRIYDGTDEATAVAVQPTSTGVRALISIDSADASEEFDFPLSGSITRLALNSDGSVTGYDDKGAPVASVAKPWAVDARGVSVPTHFEIAGTTFDAGRGASGRWPHLRDRG